MSADPRPAELTVPMAVLEGWLLKAFEAGKVAAPHTEYRIVWQLSADGTLSPLLTVL